MGFYVAKVMATFSMSLSSVMATPKSRFFWLYNQIRRMDAEKDLRLLQVLASVQNGEGYEAMFNGLHSDLGQIEEWGPTFIPPSFEFDEDDSSLDPDFDRAGLQALKARHC